MAIDLLLVDDDASFRSAARAVLGEAGFGVTAEAGSGREAIDAVARLRPGLVLLDVQLPDLDGFEVLRRLRALPTAPSVVLISTREAADRISGTVAAVTHVQIRPRDDYRVTQGLNCSSRSSLAATVSASRFDGYLPTRTR